ncbi:MotA/TolQ/ExbB proton channel family protein, partial [Thermodesulfobacteriota bacterium]
GTTRATGNDAVSFARDNPITAEDPERIDKLDKIVSAKRLPGLDDLKYIVEFYFQEMAESGKILKRTGEFIGPDGKSTTGDIIRIGRFTTYFRLPDGTAGFLKPEASGKRLVAFTGEPPGWMLSEIKDYFEGKSEEGIAPVDLSNGGFFVQLTKTITAAEKLEQGGTIMYVILGVGIFAILLGLERIIVLGTKSKASVKVMNEIKNMTSQGNWKEAQEFCSSKSRIPTCQMLDSAMDHVGASQDVLENALNESILKQIPKLERFIPTLALFAVVSPLLGLLGTVSGMIKTFEIITEVGTGDPGMLAGGISEALLTTQFGLVVAIPIMLLHHFLKSQVDKIANDMEEKGTAFIITLSKESGNGDTKEA